MLLITAAPLPTPADAERLVANLWQLTAGRSLGLYTLAVEGRLMLGVQSSHRGVEESVAMAVADQCRAAVEDGWGVAQSISEVRRVAAVNLVPTDRHLAVESRTFGWQRSDPLRGLFLALAHTPADLVVGLGLSLRALPDLAFLVSIGAFAAGDGAAPAVGRVAGALGGIGVRVRRPLLARRTAARILAASVRRPSSVQRVEDVVHFWHPPYGLDAGLAASPAGGDQSPALDARPLEP